MSLDVTILLVEDEVDIRNMLRKFLLQKGYHVIAAMNKEEALLWINKKKFDFYIFDIMLPQEDGYDLAIEVRKQQKIAPILFLTALHDIDHKIKAFNTKADDYLTKPFEFRELTARIEALLRRANSLNVGTSNVLKVEGIQLDLTTYEMTIDDEPFPLKPVTGKVMKILMDYSNKVVPKYMILESVWSENSKRTNANLDVQLHYLRNILSTTTKYSLETIRGIGMRLVIKQ